jgi:MFS family permease
MGKEFSIDAVCWDGWHVYLLALAMFLVPFSRVADIYGRKKSSSWPFCVYLFLSVCAVSSSTTQLILSRALQDSEAP